MTSPGNHPAALLMPATLPVARLTATYVARGALDLGVFAGPAVRGALGQSLRESACVTRLKDCAPCPFTHGCAYAFLFETELFPRARHGGQATAGYALGPISPAGGMLAPRAVFTVSLHLYGPAVTHGALWASALSRLGDSSFAGGALAFRHVTTCWPAAEREESGWRPPPPPSLAAWLHNPPPVDMPADLWLSYAGPARLRRKGVELTTPSFSDVVRALLRRAWEVEHDHGSPLWPPERENAVHMALAAADLVASSESRLSRLMVERRDRRVAGAVGEQVFRGAPGWLAPVVMLAAWLQIGKGVAQGYGATRVAWRESGGKKDECSGDGAGIQGVFSGDEMEKALDLSDDFLA